MPPTFPYISLYLLISPRLPPPAPQVITPEEIVDPNVDEHSVMTYLSQFPKAKLKPGAPLRPKLNPKKARAYGPGEGGALLSGGQRDPSCGAGGALLWGRGKFFTGLVRGDAGDGGYGG